MSAPNKRTIVIPAQIGTNPGVVREVASGKFYACISSTDVFTVRTDNGSEIDSETGHYIGDDNSPEFGKLTFYNRTASPITVVYYAGMVFYKPKTSTVTTVVSIGSVTITGGSVNVPSMKEAPSTTLGSGILSLASGASTAALNNANRKMGIIRNRSTSAGNLQIKDGSGAIMDELKPGDPPWAVPTNGTFILTAVGGAVDYTFGQIINT